MTEFTAPSGAIVVINPAPWKDAKMLKKAIEKEISISDVSFDFLSASSFLSMLKIDSSDGVDAALWPCLVRCTRNNEKIVESTFDSAEARADYYDIIIACIKENLSPLVESLFSKFAALGITKQASDVQKSPSATSVSS